MKKNFFTMMKHSMMAILAVAAMGMMTASLRLAAAARTSYLKTKRRLRSISQWRVFL